MDPELWVLSFSVFTKSENRKSPSSLNDRLEVLLCVKRREPHNSFDTRLIRCDRNRPFWKHSTPTLSPSFPFLPLLVLWIYLHTIPYHDCLWSFVQEPYGIVQGQASTDGRKRGLLSYYHFYYCEIDVGVVVALLDAHDERIQIVFASQQKIEYNDNNYEHQQQQPQQQYDASIPWFPHRKWWSNGTLGRRVALNWIQPRHAVVRWTIGCARRHIIIQTHTKVTSIIIFIITYCDDDYCLHGK